MPGVVESRWTAEEFLDACESFWGTDNCWMVLPSMNDRAFAACAVCKSKAIPENRPSERYPLWIHRDGGAGWFLDPTCGCSPGAILGELDGSAANAAGVEAAVDGDVFPLDRDADSKVAAIRRALIEDAQDTRDTRGPVREEVPGTSLLHRGVAAVIFGERGGGKSTVALIEGVGAAAAGERVLYLDLENGSALTRERIEGILEAHESWGDPLADGRFVGRHYPDLSPGWDGEDFGEAVAGLDFKVVIFDSFRECLSRLGLDPDTEVGISAFFALAVTPLVRRGVAVVLLDNVGHVEKHRPKGSASKLDAAPQAYQVVTTSRFSPEEEGRITIACPRSRYGDEGHEWTMRVGGGRFDAPSATDESPAARRARKGREARERFREAAVAALAEEAPLGRDRLLEAVRERGVKGRNEKLRELLADLAADPESGIVSTEFGFDLGGGPDLPGQGGATPLPASPLAPRPSPTGGRGEGRHGPSAAGTEEHRVTDAPAEVAPDDEAKTWPNI